MGKKLSLTVIMKRYVRFLVMFPTIFPEVTRGANICLHFSQGHKILSPNISFNTTSDILIKRNTVKLAFALIENHFNYTKRCNWLICL